MQLDWCSKVARISISQHNKKKLNHIYYEIRLIVLLRNALKKYLFITGRMKENFYKHIPIIIFPIIPQFSLDSWKWLNFKSKLVHNNYGNRMAKNRLMSTYKKGVQDFRWLDFLRKLFPSYDIILVREALLLENSCSFITYDTYDISMIINMEIYNIHCPFIPIVILSLWKTRHRYDINEIFVIKIFRKINQNIITFCLPNKMWRELTT